MEEIRVPGENHRSAGSSSSSATATAAHLLFLLRRRRRHRPPPPSMYVYTLFFRIQKNHPEMGFFCKRLCK